MVTRNTTYLQFYFGRYSLSFIDNWYLKKNVGGTATTAVHRHFPPTKNNIVSNDFMSPNSARNAKMRRRLKTARAAVKSSFFCYDPFLLTHHKRFGSNIFTSSRVVLNVKYNLIYENFFKKVTRRVGSEGKIFWKKITCSQFQIY